MYIERYMYMEEVEWVTSDAIAKSQNAFLTFRA